MIGMKTEAACGSCPLTLLCMMNLPLVHDTKRRHNYMRYKTIPNIHRLRVCKRCYCVFFSHRNVTYVCSQIRYATHLAGAVTHGNQAVIWAIAGRVSHQRKHVTWTKSCGRGQGKRHPPMHPLQRLTMTPISSSTTDDNWDCFDYLHDYIYEIR